MNFPVEEIRDKTPASKKQLFFNSAGSSLISLKTKEIMIDYLSEEAEVGGYKVMMDRWDETREFYKETAKLINCRPENISFQVSATDAYSKVIYALPWKSGDVILTSKDDYVSNVLTFMGLRDRFGVEFKYIPTIESGDIDFDWLESELQNNNIKMLALTHMPTSAGFIQDVYKAGEFAKKYNVLYLLDACQTVGQMHVDVQEIHCDFLTVTGRKFLRGPRGTGFLYVSDAMLEAGYAPYCFDANGAEWKSATEYELSRDALRYEYWEKSYINLLGFTQAIREINEIGIKRIGEYNDKLQSYFREQMSQMKNMIIYDHGLKKGNIITWRIDGLSKDDHFKYLEELKVNFSMGMKTSALLDFQRKNIEWMIRFSPHYFNTFEECDQFVSGFSEKYS